MGRELNTAELVHAAQRTEMKAEARRAEAAAARLQEDLRTAKEEMQGYMEQAMAEEVRTAGLQAKDHCKPPAPHPLSHLRRGCPPISP